MVVRFFLAFTAQWQQVQSHKGKYVCVVLFCRQECKKLREELREEHEEDRAAALTQLAQSKEQELNNAKESWQRKVEDLLEQVRRLHPVQRATQSRKDTTYQKPGACRIYLIISVRSRREDETRLSSDLASPLQDLPSSITHSLSKELAAAATDCVTLLMQRDLSLL